MKYTLNFKEEVVKKALNGTGRTILELCKEYGISDASIYRWIRDFKRGDIKEVKIKGPDSWSPKLKLEALLEASKLGDENLGEWLRKKGIHSDHLEKWKMEFESAEKPKRKEVSELKKKNKELERELRRKDKALAETAALLVLKKKANALFGDEED